MDWSSARHAIIVCGHAVYHGGPNLLPSEAHLDEHWFLQSFQKGEGRDYVEHVHQGVLLAAKDKDALLIFSGGQTRVPHILSEAQGYHHVAQVFNFWDQHDVRSRTTTEEFSRDSFDNVLFGIARFHECVGRIPDSITIISWAFKKARFQFHTWSIRWPQARFSFLGVGIPHSLEEAQTAEARTLACFQDDASGYGLTGGKLGSKKAARNPYRRQHGYAASCPSLCKLLAWRGTGRISEHDVPWH